MRKSTFIKILITAIFVCAIGLYTLNRLGYTEGFFDMASDYSALRTRLSTMMATYCDLASYAQEQLKIIYMSPKPLGLGATETPKEADAHVLRTYTDVYACKDEYASSRPTCSSGGISNIGFVPCDTYMKLPDLTDQANTADIAIALRKIPDDLAKRITREVDWYSQIVTKLTEAIALGMNPPGAVTEDKEIPVPPDSENSPATDKTGKPWALNPFKSGFIDYSVPQNKAWLVESFQGTCSASQAQAQINQKKAAAASSAAASCTMPTLDTEIPRVNAILDSSDLQAALAKCAALKAAMEKLKADQKKAMDGDLFPWQKDGPKKTFVKLPAGNRTDGLLSSLKQNQM